MVVTADNLIPYLLYALDYVDPEHMSSLLPPFLSFNFLSRAALSGTTILFFEPRIGQSLVKVPPHSRKVAFLSSIQSKGLSHVHEPLRPPLRTRNLRSPYDLSCYWKLHGRPKCHP